MAARLLYLALAASASIARAADDRPSLDLAKRDLPEPTPAELDPRAVVPTPLPVTSTFTQQNTNPPNPIGTSTAGTTGSVVSWSAVSGSLGVPGASLATTTALPATLEPTATLNRVMKAAAAANTCAPKYTAQTTINGVGTLPRPNAFVTRCAGGIGFCLNGKTYRPVGPNIYWLGLDQNVQPNPSYPDRGRVREAVAIAAAMGANTIRAGTLGISLGNPLSLIPVIGQPYVNQNAFAAMDYALATIRNYGLRVIIPLMDDYNYYHGGKYTFLAAYGYNIQQPGVGQNFYTDPNIRSAFKMYIGLILQHVNTVTGVAYKDDPTILGWETGNEYGAYMLQEGAPPADFTNDIASYIKSQCPNHLVMDGSDGTHNAAGSPIPGLGVGAVDMVTDHLYPLNNNLFKSDVNLANQAKKQLIIGEYDWTGLNGGSSLSSFISAVEANPYAGDMLWSVFGHDAQCCNFVTHNDGYSLYYPNGNSAALQSNILAISKHWRKMSGQKVLSYLIAVACPQPEFTP